MKCNIDLRKANGTGGISNYIRNIASNLIDSDECQFEGCTFFYKNRNSSNYNWFLNNIHYSFFPEKYAFSRYKIPFSYELLMNSKADLNVFFTYDLPSVKFKSPIVSTIHDIILLKTSCESTAIIDEHKRILERTVKLSDYILTVSEASKKDLIGYFGISDDKIAIVHNGINQSLFGKNYSNAEYQIVIDKYDLPQKFILNLGRYRKHKNIERLILAYASFPKSFRQEVKLVLSESNTGINQLIQKHSLDKDVKIIGFVDEKDKPIVFKLASLTYYASLYEGFGVPIIESQAAGTPVLTSNTSSLPEAAGGAALLVNPYDEKNIAQAVEQYFGDEKVRESLKIKGKKNAELYTWDHSVKEFYVFLNSVKL